MTKEEEILRRVAALLMEVHQLRAEVIRLTKQLTTPTINNFIQSSN